MSALSVSPVASSSSSAQAPAPADVPGDAADTSPFAMLLAAISAADPDLQSSVQQTSAQQFSVQQPSVQPGTAQTTPATDDQPPMPPAANADTGTDDDSEVVADPTVSVAQNPPPDSNEITAAKEPGKPDKKANADKSATDAVALPVPAPIPAMPLPLISPIGQAPVPTQTVAAKDDDSDISATAIVRTSGPITTPPPVALPSGNFGASTPQSVSSEPSQTGGKQPSVPPVAANDDSADDSESLNTTEAAAQAIQTANAGGVKFSQVRRPASPTAPQVPPPVDEADADIEPAPNSAAKNSSPASEQTSQTDPENAAPAFVALQAPQRSATGDKPVPDVSRDALPPQANAVAANANDPAQSFQAATEDNGSDSKPGRAAASTPSQPQANSAQPLPHIAIEAMPQPTLAFNAGATNAPGGLTLSVHVANHDFGSQSSPQPAAIPDTDSLAISVAARSLSGSKQFDIRLDPPELGRVEVRLSIDASGKTQAHMTTDQPRTLELLQKDAPNLTRALRDAGLDVSQSGLNFSLKGQSQNHGGQNGNFGAPGRNLSLPAIAQSIEAAQSAGALPSLSGNARLDIHV